MSERPAKMTAARTTLVCNCQRTVPLDGDALSAALGDEAPLTVHTELCRSGLAAFEAALAGGTAVHVACQQEAALFQEVGEDNDFDLSALTFTDIRDAGGWGEDSDQALPKMAALLAADRVAIAPAPSMTLTSNGICLVYGKGQDALDAARKLGDRLSVSVLLSDAEGAIPPARVTQPIHTGRIARAKGHLGAFEVSVDGYAAMLPSSRDEFQFAMARDGAQAKCDIILDLTGESPLFTAHDRRDGYLRVDPNNPTALSDALFEISDMVGDFEKPRYISYDASICAHSRSGLVGCTNCLDVCPVGAITPAGDTVDIDPSICGGCGNCASVCPTGAASYGMPQRGDMLARLDAALSTYETAGGARPVVVLADETHGPDLVAAISRFGRGLPAHVLPFYLPSVLSIGHEVMTGAVVLGAERMVLLPSPKRRDELGSLDAQLGIAEAFLSGLGYGEGRIQIALEEDPDALETLLHELSAMPGPARGSAQWLGTKRDVARTVLGKLHDSAPMPQEIIGLPDDAPYGRIVVDTAGCTLCLSCVGACPANALADNPERPELSFTEAACVQCGVCVATCPEKVISLEPRYNFASSALSPDVLKGDEPFLCVRCSTPFGTKATVEKVVERLQGHSMFADSEQLKLIQMCDNCRVETLANSKNDPFRGADRPMVRTTDDYLDAEARLAQTPNKPLKPDDFLG